MALINRAGQEVSAKVVYYGPGLSGKTTNLELLFKQVSEDRRGKMISMKTRSDRTLFFDLLPLSADPIRDFTVRILLYTVPGQVYYNATRRLVLKGVDAVVFVADSDPEKMEENLESLTNLHSNLADMGLKLADLPYVIQYNKRDLPNAMTVEELDNRLNPQKAPSFTASAASGEGVHETLGAVAERLRPMLEKLIALEVGDKEPVQSEEDKPSPEFSPELPTTPPLMAVDDQSDPYDEEKKQAPINLDDIPDPLVVEMSLKRDRKSTGPRSAFLQEEPEAPRFAGPEPGEDPDALSVSVPGDASDPLTEPSGLDPADEDPIEAHEPVETSLDPPSPDQGPYPPSPADHLEEASSELGSSMDQEDDGHLETDPLPRIELEDGELILHLSPEMLASGQLRLRLMLVQDEGPSSEPIRELSRKA